MPFVFQKFGCIAIGMLFRLSFDSMIFLWRVRYSKTHTTSWERAFGELIFPCFLRASFERKIETCYFSTTFLFLLLIGLCFFKLKVPLTMVYVFRSYGNLRELRPRSSLVKVYFNPTPVWRSFDRGCLFTNICKMKVTHAILTSKLLHIRELTRRSKLFNSSMLMKTFFEEASPKLR